MHKFHRLAWLLPLLFSLSPPAMAADDLRSSQMADEARMWQQKDRDDLAAALWRKLLRATPQHPEALIKLGLIEARAGNRAQAAALLARARKLARPPAGLAQLAAALEPAAPADSPVPVSARSAPPVPAATVAPVPAAKIASVPAARIASVPAAASAPVPAAKSAPAALAPAVPGKAGSAAARPSPGADRRARAAAALAALQTRAAREENWNATRASLEQLAQDNRGDRIYLLALARHLGWREATRREAVRQLSALGARRDAPAGTAAAWREALMLLAPRAGDEVLFTAYQARFPRDAQIGARRAALAAAGAPDPSQPVAAAPTAPLQAALTAAILPDRTAAPAPAQGSGQKRTASLLRDAAVDERGGAYASAAAKLESAMLLAPNNAPVRIALARQYQRLERAADAENLLDALLEASPDLPAALHARALLYGARQRWADGLDLLERIGPERRDPAIRADQRKLWIGAQSERARQMHAMGDFAGATALVTAAQQAASAGDLAQVAGAWNAIGRSGEGLRLLRQHLSDGTPHDMALRLDYAQILQDGFEDAELGTVLRDLAAPGRLAPAQQARLDQITLVYHLRQAEQLREEGRLAEAATRLAPWMARGDDVRLLMSMARIRRDAADPAAALVLVERAIARRGEDLGARLLACELALALNDSAKAAPHATAALAAAPRHPRALSCAGRLARARANLPEALALFQRASDAENDAAAVAGVPGSHALRLLGEAAEQAPVPAGRILLAEGDHAGAMRQLADALRLRPLDATAMHNLAVATAAAGNYQAALALLMRARAAAPAQADIATHASALRAWVKSYGGGAPGALSAGAVSPPPPALWGAAPLQAGPAGCGETACK